jgi:hypothetical protein
MPALISQPSTVEAAGTLPRTVADYAGRVNTGTDDVSIALMTSPTGWQEPGQRPEFDEWTVVLRGLLVLDMRAASWRSQPAGRSRSRLGVGALPGPYEGGTEYVSVCLPAFSRYGAPRRRVASTITRSSRNLAEIPMSALSSPA